jgi:FkbM family methyltransferase
MIDIVKNIIEKDAPNLIKDGKLIFPNWAKKIKIDIGTSINAPNSEVWLNGDEDLVVLAFEPNPHNIKHLYDGEKIWPIHIDKSKLNDSFFVLNCALSNFTAHEMDFYCTENDGGTSSLYKPNHLSIKDVIKIPVITLDDVFINFDWDKFKYIEQIKIDAQGSDFKIIQGCINILKKIVFITLETSTGGHYNLDDVHFNYDDFFIQNNFSLFSVDGANATYINNDMSHLKHEIKFFFENT